MCHKLVALHVWTHTGGRFRGERHFSRHSVQELLLPFAAFAGRIASTYCTRRAAPKKNLKNAKSWALRDDQSGKSRTLP